MGNPWLAIDAATAPAERARELRRAWERFLGEGRLDAVRAPIADSWRRSLVAGVDPAAKRIAPLRADPDETSALWQVHPLAAAAPVIRNCLASMADEAEDLIVVSDADGVLLWIEGNDRVRFDAADSMNFTEGALWSEVGAGTNAIGTALAADHAVQVFAAEHFNEVVQEWTCSAAPVHDPDSGELLGIVDVTGKMRTVHPHGLACAAATAQAVEAHLQNLVHEHDAHLRSRYEERVATGSRRVLVTPTGRIIAGRDDGWVCTNRLDVPPGGGELTLPSGVHAFAEPVGYEEAFVVSAIESARPARHRPFLKLTVLGRDHASVKIDGKVVDLGRRHTEILALLSLHPDGMTSEELATDLYGDGGQSGTARVQIFRMRKVLGPWIETDPYRLSMDVESDLGHVRGLLARGEIREAAERYDGPLLPHSEAPGLVRERDALDDWLRQAVLTAENDEALWAWVRSPSGTADLQAWKRLLSHLDFHDPRRSLAAARVRSLRAASS